MVYMESMDTSVLMCSRHLRIFRRISHPQKCNILQHEPFQKHIRTSLIYDGCWMRISNLWNLLIHNLPQYLGCHIHSTLSFCRQAQQRLFMLTVFVSTFYKKLRSFELNLIAHWHTWDPLVQI